MARKRRNLADLYHSLSIGVTAVTLLLAGTGFIIVKSHSGESWNQREEIILLISLVIFVLNAAALWVKAVSVRTTERESAHRATDWWPHSDPLTGLPRHRWFVDYLEEKLADGNNNRKTAVILLDIDNFKLFNQTMGYRQGDQLLKSVSEVVRQNLRRGDVVCRYGADELGIIAPCDSLEEARALGSRLAAEIESCPFGCLEQLPGGIITVSVGVAVSPDHGESSQELLKHAEEALENVKHQQLDKYAIYFPVIKELEKGLLASEKDFITTVKTLLSLVNAKDRYTYGHTQRVLRYALMIARKLGLPEEEIKIIGYGALLHDLGKVYVPNMLLKKKGKLTEEEFDLVKKHPVIGAEIIKPIRSLRSVIPAVLHHHERYDGKGYPQGLKGKEIPLHARIMAVADSFDAMTTNRPYRPAKSVREAVEELRRCAGTQFDPEIVWAFIAALEEDKESRIS